VVICAAILLVATLACGRYGPPRWNADSTIPTAPVQSDPDEVSIAPNPEMQEQIGVLAREVDPDVDNEEVDPEADTP